MKKITYDIESNVQRFHWWFAGRRRLLQSLITSWSSGRENPVIDIGCGVGSNLNLLRSTGFKVIGIDSQFYPLSIVRKRFAGVPLINGDLMNLPLKVNSVSLIIATDILEHLNEDSIGIKEIQRVLRSNGKVIFTVPAFQFLWGIQDIFAMHKRRYSQRELLRRIEKEGLQVTRSSYFNFFLFLPIFFSRRLIRLLGIRIESENEINTRLLNFFLKTVFSLEAHILKYISFPFGVSILCIAEKGKANR